jgi:single-strand DNA-binding protein
VNKIFIIGNLGQDPTMRYTPSGQVITSFSVSSNHRYKTASGEQQDQTEWFNCQAWGKLAETCNQYLLKGQKVYVEGMLASRIDQAKDGTACFSFDVTVNDVQFVGQRNEPTLGGEAEAILDLPY